MRRHGQAQTDCVTDSSGRHRTEARSEAYRLVGLVFRTVVDTALVVDDSWRVDFLALVVLNHRDCPLEHVKHVRAIGMFVSLEFSTRSEREGLHEDIVADDQFRGLDLAGSRLEVVDRIGVRIEHCVSVRRTAS